MVAVPLLGEVRCSGWRSGLLTDRIAARRAGLLGMSPDDATPHDRMALGGQLQQDAARRPAAGRGRGELRRGASPGEPMVSACVTRGWQWASPARATSGTALATFFGPRLALVWGWHAVFGLALIPLVVDPRPVPCLRQGQPRTSRRARPLSTYADVLKLADTWWFCLSTAITFGGFVGLASFLNVFFLSQYGLSKVEAGSFATFCVIAGSALRPLGGYLADRFGGVRVADRALSGRWDDDARPGDASAYASLERSLLFAIMATLGMGNGAVFQLVPQRFPEEIGVTTGIVGSAGGFGGFLLPTVLGVLKQATGSFSGGFLAFALVGGIGGALALAYASRGWHGTSSERAEGPRSCRSRLALHSGRGVGRRLASIRQRRTLSSENVMHTPSPTPFDGLRVAIFEGRMAGVLADLVAKQGGIPVSAPSLTGSPPRGQPRRASVRRRPSRRGLRRRDLRDRRGRAVPRRIARASPLRLDMGRGAGQDEGGRPRSQACGCAPRTRRHDRLPSSRAQHLARDARVARRETARRGSEGRRPGIRQAGPRADRRIGTAWRGGDTSPGLPLGVT